MNIGIVVVGYNRLQSLFRLLNSLQAAEYSQDHPDLIISLDQSEQQATIKKAVEEFLWTHGNKIIKTYEKRIGLRSHILQCGDLTDEYDAIIVLEDDLVVAKGFYNYVKQTLSFYSSKEKIAGISLYTHLINQGTGRIFQPANNGNDIFMMQMAQSWGQCWTRSMWREFRLWYESHSGKLPRTDKLPSYILHWNDKSWLKYYIWYIIEQNKYFVYPYISLTTNCSEIGEHCDFLNNDYQVPLLEDNIVNYRMPNFNQSVRYDAFYERVDILDNIFTEYPGKKVLDLYGYRTDYCDADILISTKPLPYKVLKEVALKYRPHEVNCLMPEDGEGIYIYDCHNSAKKPFYNKYVIERYDIKALHWKKTLHHGIIGLLGAIKTRLFKRK